MNIRCFLYFLVFAGSVEVTYSQLLIGPVAGAQYSWVRFDDEADRNAYRVKPVWGYHAGLGVSFQVRKRFFMNTSILYSTKGKEVESKQDPILKNSITYKYIDIPLIYSVDFKAKLGNLKEFKYYFGIGPNISYWLGGKGKIYTLDFYELSLPEREYKLAFEKDSEDINEYEASIENPNRLQLGLNLATGFVLEPRPYQKLMFILRYEFGHSFLSEGNAFFRDTYYEDVLRARNQGLRASLTYMVDLRPDQRKKGKSTIDKRRLH